MDSVALQAAEDWLLAAVQRPHERRPLDELPTPALLTAATYHGMVAWLFLHARCLGLTQALRDELGAHVMREVAFAQNRAALMRSLCTAFAELGATTLVLKGAAYAETLYERPWHRPSGDLDLLIDPGHLPTIKAWLRQHGWTEALTMAHGHASSQSSWSREAEGLPVAVTLDLHWHISNAHWFAQTARYASLHGESEVFAPPSLRWPGRCNALLHACAHRAMHLRTAPVHLEDTGALRHERLIWLRDIRLLARSLSPAEQRRVIDKAAASKLSTVVNDALEKAFAVVAAKPPFTCAQTARHEPAALVLKWGAAGSLLADLWSMPDLPSKLALVRAHLFPCTRYMRKRFDAPGAVPVMALHAWRLGRGLFKFLMRSLPRRART